MSDEEIRRGNEAERLLKEPLLCEAFEMIEAECIKQWKDAPARDTDGRERIWMMLKLLDKLKAHIVSIADTGKLASAKVAEEAKARKIFNLMR